MFMPFGLIFGAIFFGLLCGWLGLQFVETGGATAKIGGLLMVALGLSLALALLKRRVWARFAGIVVALGLTVFSLWLVNRRGESIEQLVLFASVLTAILLIVPATGDVRRVPPGATLPAPVTGRWLPLTTLLSVVGLIAVLFTGYGSVQSETVAPVSREIAGLQRIHWTDFGAGIKEARAQQQPLLVNFSASWCGYCKKMDRTTWRDPAVLAMLDAVVPVLVDIESTTRQNGFQGVELASQYQVSSTPTLVLLDGRGQVISRSMGYLTGREVLEWVEDALRSTLSSREL
jgi:thiol:disulfide interchange protein DsbD